MIDHIKGIDLKNLPRHIAIIMDGNGRWAKARFLPRSLGHKAGMEAFKRIIETAAEIGIPYLTVFAFSTENWKRPQEEVNYLMNLLVEYVDYELQKIHHNNIRVKTIGYLQGLPEKARLQVYKAEEITKNNTGLNLQIALNYGSRQEIIYAIQQISEDVKLGTINVNNIDEQLFADYLFTSGIPDPDLIIRSSGEKRISNFMLWQSAYAEFWVTEELWPDFMPEHLCQAIADFQKRKRRFGGI